MNFFHYPWVSKFKNLYVSSYKYCDWLHAWNIHELFSPLSAISYLSVISLNNTFWKNIRFTLVVFTFVYISWHVRFFSRKELLALVNSKSTPTMQLSPSRLRTKNSLYVTAFVSLNRTHNYRQPPFRNHVKAYIIMPGNLI